jgi:polyketide synthase PksN
MLSTASVGVAAVALHPLVHQNTSNLSEQSFTSNFRGDEFFLSDHVVKGLRVLPAVAYLEMARAAVQRSAGHHDNASKWPAERVQLKNVVFARPLVVEEPRTVHIALHPESSGEIAFEIYSRHSPESEDRIIHASGVALLDGTEEINSVDLAALQAQCGENFIEQTRCYELFRNMGLNYGPAFRGLQHLTWGADEGGRFVLARIRMPESLPEEEAEYALHPSLVDAALQGTIGLMDTESLSITAALKPALPFALERLEILSIPPKQASVLIREVGGGGQHVQKQDVYICNEQGRICVCLRGFSVRTLQGALEEVLEGQAESVPPPESTSLEVSEKNSETTGAPVATAFVVEQNTLETRTARYLRGVLARELKLEPQTMEVTAPLEEYGINSIVVLRLTGELEKSFGSLPKTLLFEYRTIETLAGYFLQDHRERLIQILGGGQEITSDRTAYPIRRPGPVKERPQNAPQRQRFADGQHEKPLHGGQEIAIVGLAGRYPQARNIHEFWENLKAGKDCITEIPMERWDHNLYFDPNKGTPGKSYSKWGGFIEGAAEFDPLFFNISPRDAEMMDPQERLFLQCVYETLEDAGTTREALGRPSESGLAGNVGVFVGVMYEEYQLFGAQAQALGQKLAVTGSPASIANRISFFCNFHGPSMAVDTMCSSSLTAIHLACQSLQRGECEAAIAGGVNLSLHPNKYLTLAQGQFVSNQGRCESFGIGGDGYVPGEGVGAVLLKPLAKAVADRDQIYGVIRASVLNHGGRTNGYTVPNPAAQAHLIASALRKSELPVRAISYVEAHGTGTSLGDPIEIAGLNAAFAEFTKDKQFCAIGSVKSNIGHCESAAGIAGLTKVLLQMKHKMLVPSLHAQTLNPYIAFEDSPFVVQRERAEWTRPRLSLDGRAKECPRIAGVSSFGAGGSNAHLIVEEYIPSSSAGVTANMSGPAIVVLSARSEQQLHQRAADLHQDIEVRQLGDSDLLDLAYTLQVGREAMEHRLALTASCIAELRSKLLLFIRSTEDIADFYQGDIKRNKEIMSVLARDEDLQGAIEGWIHKGKYERLLDLWVKGLNIDWEKIYDGQHPRRLSLSTYPFAREKCWIPLPGVPVQGRGHVGNSILHPLLHHNTSDLFEQRFTSHFIGEEFYLKDHVVQGARTLPASAYLEMARVAAEFATGQNTGVDQDLKPVQLVQVVLKDVVFVRPLIVKDDSASLQTRLRVEENGEISFEMHSADKDCEPIVHCRGKVAQFRDSGLTGPLQIDVASLRAKCTNVFSAGSHYDFLSDLGLQYGPSHRGLNEVLSGIEEDGRRFVLARLGLPSVVGHTRDLYVLHPSVIDAGLQAVVGLMEREEGTAYVPFSIDHIEVLAACPVDGYACLRELQAERDRGIRKVDMDVLDEHGRVHVRLRGLSVRVVERDQGHKSSGVQLFKPEWTTEILGEDVAGGPDGQHWIVACTAGAPSSVISTEFLSRIEAKLPGVRTSVIEASGMNAAEKAIDSVLRVFELLQRILREGVRPRSLIQVLTDIDGASMLFDGLSGLLKTAQLENPNLRSQVIGLGPAETEGSLLRKIHENSRTTKNQDIRYQSGERQVKRWLELDSELEWKPWRDGGVYLISGGVGGLGLLFAREITQQTRDAKLVLTGRSAITDEKWHEMKRLEANGSTLEYRQIDVADKQAVERLTEDIRVRFGVLHGVIHSAGVIKDAFIIKKTRHEFEAVLAPKIDGAVNLDHATREFNLDFFAMFSSVTGAIGNVGQADYASGNSFLDGYSHYRHELALAGQRHGRTVAINWPLWQDGGMQVDTSTMEWLRANLGLSPLATGPGIRAFYRALALQMPQVLVMNGDKAKGRALLQPVVSAAAGYTPPLASGNMNGDRDALLERTVLYLKTLIAEPLKLGVDQIEADAPFERYGVDSVLVMELTRQLEKHFGPLPKTLFFEYQSPQDLASYFLKEHRERLGRLIGPPDTVPSIEPAPNGTAAARTFPTLRQTRLRSFPSSSDLKLRIEPGEGIAIIGMSGRYPQAKNVVAFWENLKSGKDCITEIPKARWDHSRYFDPEKGKPGKSYSKWGGFIDGVDEFDPLFFNISPREAKALDPQERLFLQCAYETLEDAGYTRETLSRYHAGEAEGSIGVFVGVMYEEYQLYGAQAQALGRPVVVSSSPSSIANRVSYFCNFHGPSLALDTMCSSSLTALHYACDSLRHGGCDLAIAGGVNVSIHPNKYLALAQGEFVSSQGRCESFGEGGDGYVPGEGVGAVLLKPLPRAISDRDHIYGVITATAINHGGKTNGYSVPSPIAQAKVIAHALKQSGIAARNISYIEAHGTGTRLGDPIEIAGLTRAFSEFTSDKQFCAIGSAKSNIGHAESAAGIAGLTKVLLQMKHALLAPSLHAETFNAHIDFANSPFKVQRELGEWKRPFAMVDGERREYPRIAGISSFGAGGSNAHVIVQEYIAAGTDAPPTAVAESRPAIIILSAKTESQLVQQARNLLRALEEDACSETDLENIAFTLQVGREAMECRLAILTTSIEDLRVKVTRLIEGEQRIPDVYRGEVKRNKEALALFRDDQELQEAVEKWMQRGKYSKLLDAWVRGLNVDWYRLYGDVTPRRISLPTYPFSTERYWIDIPELERAMDGAGVPLPAMPSVEGLPQEEEEGDISRVERFLQKTWLPSPAQQVTSARPRLFILSNTGTSELANRLVEEFPGSRVFNVDLPDSLSLDGNASWEGYGGWVDVVGCGQTESESWRWMTFLQKWIEHGPKSSALALCVTRCLESYRNATMNLSGASRVGLYRMLQHEYRHLRSRHMDTNCETGAALIDQVICELLADDTHPEVCYRDGERYRATLQEISEFSTEAPRPTFPSDGVLWVTGGTRGIGYACAKHFLLHYGMKRMVLTGREILPPREEWHAYESREDSVGRKIRAIQALEQHGAEIKVSAVSLADERAIRNELAEVRQRWGPVCGVIHSAGLIDKDNPAFIRKSLDTMEAVLSPKVSCLNNLVKCFEQEPLQFFVLFSSVSGIVPGLAVGQSDYGMANAYMDYVAEAFGSTRPLTSIQWPNWKESGLGEVKNGNYRQAGFLSHTDAEGLRLLDLILAAKRHPVILPAIVNVASWDPDQLVRGKAAYTNGAHPSTASDLLAEKAHKWLLSLASEQLNIDISKLEIDLPLQDYGADSVMLVQVLQSVSRAVGEKLDPSILYQYPTIQEFATWLLKHHRTEMVKTLEAPTSEKCSEQRVLADQSDKQPSVAIVEVEARHSNPDLAPSSDIAVVGMSCRVPGANDLQEYWQLLAQGRSAIGLVPKQRWGYASNYHAALLDNITDFDAALFRIPASTAAVMDPQALLVLEESLKACCHAGYSQAELKASSTGVYLGARSQHHPSEEAIYEAQDSIVAVGQNYLASNISRYFDLRGPSLVVDTACSSALVAMQVAIQALLTGEIATALVGAVSLLQTDAVLRIFERRGILHPGPCFHIFDKRANGAVLGEAVGMVLLKTLDRALRDRDTVYAVIKSIAVNNEGRTAGPTAPNFEARQDVMRKALERSRRHPEEIIYIDVNGSGSEIADLLELKAIEAVYRSGSKISCRLGSMKPNIGHPLCAEGIASFIKVALTLHNGYWVPFLSAQQPMNHYDFSTSQFQFSHELERWDGEPRIAAINCFADGGTNAHVVVESWKPLTPNESQRKPILPPTFNRVNIYQPKPLHGKHAKTQRELPDAVIPMRFWKRALPGNPNGKVDGSVSP